MSATGTPTPNLGLRIPLGTDPASVDDINYNSNALDTIIGDIGETSVAGQLSATNNKISAVQAGLAIVCNGNTHAAIESGQFAYVKNHGTLAEGLYRNNTGSTIAANATLSSSNLTADSSGGLNTVYESLNGKITPQVIFNGTIPFETGVYYVAVPITIGGITIPAFSFYDLHVSDNDGTGVAINVTNSNQYILSGLNSQWQVVDAISNKLVKKATMTVPLGTEDSYTVALSSIGIPDSSTIISCQQENVSASLCSVLGFQIYVDNGVHKLVLRLGEKVQVNAGLVAVAYI